VDELQLVLQYEEKAELVDEPQDECGERRFDLSGILLGLTTMISLYEYSNFLGLLDAVDGM